MGRPTFKYCTTMKLLRSISPKLLHRVVRMKGKCYTTLEKRQNKKYYSEPHSTSADKPWILPQFSEHLTGCNFRFMLVTSDHV